MAVKDIIVPAFVGTDTIKWIVTRGLSLGAVADEWTPQSVGAATWTAADPTAATWSPQSPGSATWTPQ